MDENIFTALGRGHKPMAFIPAETFYSAMW